MNRHLLLGIVISLASFVATGCDSTSVGGGDGSGGGEESGEGGAGGNADQIDDEAADDEDETVDDGSETEVCEGEKPSGCLYGVPVYCETSMSPPVWMCSPTPLVLSFDGAPIHYVDAELAGFDLTGAGQSVASDWPAATTPWLALDRDGDGAIGSGAELFGSAVTLASGRMATNGFEALAELDGNRDGRIDASDARFGELRVWADGDADRDTDAGELTSAAVGASGGAGARARRIVSIDLDYRIATSCDGRGNCGVERAGFTWADAEGMEHRGEVVDVHLPLR